MGQFLCLFCRDHSMPPTLAFGLKMHDPSLCLLAGTHSTSWGGYKPNYFRRWEQDFIGKAFPPQCQRSSTEKQGKTSRSGKSESKASLRLKGTLSPCPWRNSSEIVALKPKQPFGRVTQWPNAKKKKRTQNFILKQPIKNGKNTSIMNHQKNINHGSKHIFEEQKRGSLHPWSLWQKMRQCTLLVLDVALYRSFVRLILQLQKGCPPPK